MNNNMTLEEKERYAWLQGDYKGAEMYARLMDAEEALEDQEDIQMLKSENASLASTLERIRNIADGY